MAQKIKKASFYDINSLKEEYFNYLSENFLTTDASQKIDGLTQKIEDLEAKREANIFLINTNTDQLERFNEKRSSEELYEAISQLEVIVKCDEELKKREIFKSQYEHFDINSVKIESNKQKFIETFNNNEKQIKQLNKKIQEAKQFSSFDGNITPDQAKVQIEKLKHIINLRNNITIIGVDNENIEKEIKQVKEEKENALTAFKTQNNNTEEKFKEFLISKNLPTSHSQEILDLINNNQNLTMSENSFKMRKRHTKRDRFIKRGVIPTAVVAGTVGGVAGNLASQSLIAGATAHGFIPVMGSIGFTTAVVGTIGVMAGLAATPVIIATKNGLTKLHYNIWYKNAESNLSDYINATDIENLRISKLMEKVENSKHTIYDLGQGNWLSRKLKFIPKHFVNAVNRNRIHHIEKYTKQLMAMYAKIENSSLDAAKKAEQLKPIYDLLQQVESFVATDLNESKLYSMLTCKENGKHSHKSTIENIDIFANLKIYLDTVGLATSKQEVQAKAKKSNKIVKNLQQKQTVATRLLNGERLIPKMINYQQDYSKFNALSPKEFTVVSQTIESDGSSLVVLSNGKSIKLNTNEFDANKKISSVVLSKNKTVFNYEDGSKTETIKTKKLIPEIETARKVMFDKLKTNDFVETLKQQGYATITINTLSDKLEAWLKNTSSKFTLSGKTKELYNDTMTIIKGEELTSSI